MILNDFIKQRGCAACLSRTLSFFGNNIATIFKKTLSSVAILSVCIGLFASIITNLMTDMANVESLLLIAGINVAQAIMIVLLASWTTSRFLTLISEDKLRRNFVKCITLNILWTFIFMVCFALLIAFLDMSNVLGMHDIAKQIVLILVCILIIVISMVILGQPLVYTSMKYILKPSQTIKNLFGHDYAVGFHHKWFLMKALLIITTLTFVASIVCHMPMQMLAFSVRLNTIGMLGGDANGLPTYFPIVAFIAGAIMSFILCYMGFFNTIFMAYICGSIEAKQNVIIAEENSASHSL